MAFDAPQLLDDTTISIAFEKNPLHRNCSQNDRVHLVVYCPEYKSFDFSDAILRRNKRIVMQLNEAWAGKEVHLWGFVVDNAGRASQSVYIGSGVLVYVAFAQDADSDECAENEPDKGVKRGLGQIDNVQQCEDNAMSDIRKDSSTVSRQTVLPAG